MSELNNVNYDKASIEKVLAELKKQSEEIYDSYKNHIVDALVLSKNCIKVSGLDFAQTLTSFDQVFDKISDRLGTLTSFLQNNVITRYDALGAEIRTMFDKDFASKMASLLAGMGATLGTIQGASTTESYLKERYPDENGIDDVTQGDTLKGSSSFAGGENDMYIKGGVEDRSGKLSMKIGNAEKAISVDGGAYSKWDGETISLRGRNYVISADGKSLIDESGNSIPLYNLNNENLYVRQSNDGAKDIKFTALNHADGRQAGNT